MTNAKELEYICSETEDAFDVELLPDQLTKLTLSGIRFATNILFDAKLHEFPHLTALKLKLVRFKGPIQKYLRFPKLRRLELHSVHFISYQNDDFDIHEEWRAAGMLAEADFFLGVPHLEYVSLKRMPVNASLAVVLQNQSSIQHLSVKRCPIEAFIPSILSFMPDRRAFPSLKSLHIDNSWPTELGMSYKEFALDCIQQRPDLRVSGNGNHYAVRS
jgi:hypothetical protein